MSDTLARDASVATAEAALHAVLAGTLTDLAAVIGEQAINREAVAEPPATRQHGPGAFHATGEWMERNGITRIESVGAKLDPNRHQAMIELPSDQEPGTIIQEMQAGYMIKDRLLRPALVGVAKAAEQPKVDLEA